jgi:ParB family chromosome partitioning protein
MPTHPVASQLLPVSQIHPNPDQPRKLFDPQAMADLKKTIDQQGLINAISVMLRGEGDYLIMAGERRFRACCELGWKEIEARIWPAGTPTSEIELISLVENLQRVDLTPLEVANGLKVLTEPPYSLTQEQVAEQSGKSRGTISQYLMIGGLKPQVQEIANRLANLELAHLLQICRLKTPEDQISMAQVADQKELPVKELKTLIDQKLKGKTPKYDPWADLKAQRNKDPYGVIWPAMLDQVRVSGINGDWNVKFESGSWHFQVRSSHIQNQEDLGRWFLDMGKGLGAGKGKADEPAATAEPAALATPPPPKAPTSTPAPAPAKAKPHLDDLDPEIRAWVEEDRKLGRLP